MWQDSDLGEIQFQPKPVCPLKFLKYFRNFNIHTIIYPPGQCEITCYPLNNTLSKKALSNRNSQIKALPFNGKFQSQILWPFGFYNYINDINEDVTGRTSLLLGIRRIISCKQAYDYSYLVVNSITKRTNARSTGHNRKQWKYLVKEILPFWCEQFIAELSFIACGIRLRYHYKLDYKGGKPCC
jgi:hypothetical protein